MSQVEPGDWVNRLSDSIRDHESTRRRFRSQPPRYEVRGELGRGGMGVIYRAWDSQLGREVALKVLSLDAADSAEARERFLREAQLAAQLSHPNIVPVYDSGEHEGQIFLAMQLIDGPTLDRSKLQLKDALTAMRDAARAVQHAHEHGIIHRDLKPSNLMIDRQGRVFVADFGLARRSDGAAGLTLSGCIMGTPAYMPPEQARGQAVDARSDVYSLGATMYEVLSGKAPFSGPNGMEVMKAVLLDEPPFPRRHNPAIPKDIEAVIVKAMAKSPSARYATAGELADDLQHWLKGEAVRAPMRGTLYRFRKKVLRHRWRVLAGAAAAAFFSLGVFFLWYHRRSYYHDVCQRIETEIGEERFSNVPPLLKELEPYDPAMAEKLRRKLAVEEKAARMLTEGEAKLTGGDLAGAENTAGVLRDLSGKRAERLERRIQNEREINELVIRFGEAVKQEDPAAARVAFDKIQVLNPSRSKLIEGTLTALENKARMQRIQDRLDRDPFASVDDDISALDKERAKTVRLDRSGRIRDAINQLRIGGKFDDAARRLVESKSWLDEATFVQLVRSLFDDRLQLLEVGAKDVGNVDFEAGFRFVSEPIFKDQLGRDRRTGEIAEKHGLYCARGNQPKDAILWLGHAESLGIKTAALYQERGLVYVTHGEWDLARADLATFRKLAPEASAPTLYSRLFHHDAQDQMTGQQWNEALKNLKEALAADKTFAAAHHDLGRALAKLGKPVEESLEELRLAAAADPLLKPHADYSALVLKQALAAVARAWTMDDAAAREKAWRDAEEFLSLVLEKGEIARADLRLERARLRRRLGRLDEALEDAGKAPKSAESLRLRAQIRFVRAHGDTVDHDGLERALADLEQAQRSEEPAHPGTCYLRGVCLQALGRDEEALKDFEFLSRQANPSPDVLLRLSRAATLKGEWDVAIKFVSRGLAALGDFREEEHVIRLFERDAVPPSVARARMELDLRLMRIPALLERKQFGECLDDGNLALALEVRFPESLRKTLGLATRLSKARSWMAMSLHGQKKYGEAVKLFEKAREGADSLDAATIEDWINQCKVDAKKGK